MNVIDALNWRYAVRQFSEEKIDDEKLTELLTATRLSPTSYGLQPYRLIVVCDPDVRKKLLAYSMGQDKVFDSSHLIVFAAQTDIDDEMVDHYIHSVAETRGISTAELDGFAEHVKHVFRNMDAEEKHAWAHQQAYIALGTLLTTAALMKIDSCPMGGFESEGFDRVLGLDKLGLESSVICAIGLRHPNDTSAQLPKVRFSHSEMVYAV